MLGQRGSKFIGGDTDLFAVAVSLNYLLAQSANFVFHVATGNGTMDCKQL